MWCFTSAAVRDKGLVHSFSAGLWKSDCYGVRSEISGIDTRITPRWPPAADGCRHDPLVGSSGSQRGANVPPGAPVSSRTAGGSGGSTKPKGAV